MEWKDDCAKRMPQWSWPGMSQSASCHPWISSCPVTEPGLSLHHHQLHHQWADQRQGEEWEGGQGGGQHVLGAEGGGVQDQGHSRLLGKRAELFTTVRLGEFDNLVFIYLLLVQH